MSKKLYEPEEFFQKMDESRGKVNWSLKTLMEHVPSLEPEKFKNVKVEEEKEGE